ncbi:NUDIX hydrolase [Sphingobacterium olei]|uniref:hypothetical protein n=1 Tax=Sphingobacterium olei TaxID=2571155 RepID=UPI00138FA0D1|nr:hypothetical protein [Sphingobacterium olei]
MARKYGLSAYPSLCNHYAWNYRMALYAQAIWVDYSELLNYDWAAADPPIVKALMQ